MPKVNVRISRLIVSAGLHRDFCWMTPTQGHEKCWLPVAIVYQNSSKAIIMSLHLALFSLWFFWKKGSV
jgi:hypothetical protein